MEKEKPRYQPKQKSPTQVEEPMVVYGGHTEPMSFLATLHPEQVKERPLPGGALADIQRQTSLSAQVMADVIGVGKSKYYDLLKLADLGAKNIDALADFANLWEAGLQAFDDKREHLLEWLHTYNENLGGIRPVELLGSRMGRRALEKSFLRIEHSVYG